MFPGEMTSFLFTGTTLSEKQRFSTIAIQDPVSNNNLAMIDSEQRGKHELDFILRNNEGVELGRFIRYYSMRKVYAQFYLPDSPEPKGVLKQGWGLSFSFKQPDGKKLYAIKTNWNEKILKVVSLLLKEKPEIAVATKMSDKTLNPDDYPFKLDINPTTEQATRILLLMIFPVLYEMRVRYYNV